MSQAEGVTEFVQRHAEHVGVDANVPALGVVKKHVAGDGLGVGRRGVEGVGQNAAGAVEG